MVLRVQKKIVTLFLFVCFPFVNGDVIFTQNSTASNAPTASNNSIQTTESTSNVIVPPILPIAGGNTSNPAGSGKYITTNVDKADVVGANSSDSLGSVVTRSNLVPKENQQDLFKRNVFIRTGLNLPVYGADLFVAPSSFSPVQNIPVPAGYVVGPGDRLQVQVWGAVDANIDTNVAPDGSIFVPKVGSIPVTGVKAGNLDGYLSKKLGKSYKNFSISTSISKVRSIQVTVAGYANQPGTYQLSSLSTLTNAILAVGGPSSIGSLRKVELKRNGRIITVFDMYSILLRGDDSKDLHLLPGDIIYFPPVGSRVAIYEGVKQPAIYEALDGDTVDALIGYAGGYSFDGKHDKIVLETIDAAKQISVNVYNMPEAGKFRLSDGEIVHLFNANNKYINSVAVVGSVANPTRVGYHDGMRVKDLIPNKEFLLTNSYRNSYAYNTYGKDNILTQKEVEKNTDNVPSSEVNFSSGLNSTSGKVSAQQVFGGGQNLFTAGPINIPVANINWNYAVVIRTDPVNFQTHLIPFNLSKAIAGDSVNNIKLQPGDVVNVLSSKDVRNPTKQGVIYVFIDGEVMVPGVYEVSPNTLLPEIIEKAGGVSSNAYLFGLELDRDSVKKRQQAALNQMLDQVQQTIYNQTTSSVASSTQVNQVAAQQYAMQQQQAFIDKMRNVKPTGRIVLNLKSSKVSISDIPSIVLENGDTIYVPSKPSVVDVVGQVFNPASFAYNEDYTVTKYINLAGTETQFADTSYEYVLRADGTLYSRQQAGWFGGFGGTRLNPGDVIIVPQQIQYGAAIQNLLNWTQILSNFGTAAAAIQVFR